MHDDDRRRPANDPSEPWTIEVFDEPWAPTLLEDERRRRERFVEELRPLVESLRRLRDRGLLD